MKKLNFMLCFLWFWVGTSHAQQVDSTNLEMHKIAKAVYGKGWVELKDKIRLSRHHPRKPLTITPKPNESLS